MQYSIIFGFWYYTISLALSWCKEHAIEDVLEHPVNLYIQKTNWQMAVRVLAKITPMIKS